MVKRLITRLAHTVGAFMLTMCATAVADGLGSMDPGAMPGKPSVPVPWLRFGCAHEVIVSIRSSEGH